MKKISFAIIILALCLALVACGGPSDETTAPDDTANYDTAAVDTPDDHVHTNKVADAVDATCTQEGLTDGIFCADCGKTVVEQTATPLAPHKYENGACKVCGTEAVASKGLQFVADSDGNYVVEGIGSCTDTQIVIPETYEGKAVVAIAGGAFADNGDIVQVVIPASVKKIGSNAFNRCINLASVSLAEGVESIGEKAFMYCTSLETVVVPDSVKTIQNGAFMACYGLEEVTLGAGLDKIASDVFFECYSLEVVDIAAGIKSIGDWAFYDCDMLTTVNFAGTDSDWNSIEFGKYWDENSGAYNVSCAGGKSVHKHVYGDWYETGAKCEWARKCSKCSNIQNKYEHPETSAQWTFTSEGVLNKCKLCGNDIEAYLKSDVILALDFDVPVSEQIVGYPYFRLVSDGGNKYEKDGNRSIWAVNSTTWLDYDKRAFDNLSYYSITFDMKVSGNPKGNMRDNSVISFVPGTNNGVKVGSSQAWIWQIKYLPLLGKLTTKQLNGVDVAYKTVESGPDSAAWNSTNSIDFAENTWVTVDVVCDVAQKLSYIFVDGTPIGSVATFDYSAAKYGDAFSFRFCDVPDFGTKFDNFKIQAMTAD